MFNTKFSFGEINCCKDCVSRRSGCHSVCDKYISQKARADRSKELHNQDNKMIDYAIQNHMRLHRIANR